MSSAMIFADKSPAGIDLMTGLELSRFGVR
jgi:hypothetical protein